MAKPVDGVGVRGGFQSRNELILDLLAPTRTDRLSPPDRGYSPSGPFDDDPRKARTVRAVKAQMTGMGIEDFEIGVLYPERMEKTYSRAEALNTLPSLQGSVARGWEITIGPDVDAPGVRPDWDRLSEQCAAMGDSIHLRMKRKLMMLRQWNVEQVIKNIPWLRRMNGLGSEIYIRPAKPEGLVLLDDLDKAMLARMRKDGFTPAATVETSPGNYQAWVRLGDNPDHIEVQNKPLLTAVSRNLAQRYDADLNSADWRHFGRLGGFTNRKPQYVRNGFSPYVLVHACSGKTCPQGPKLVDRVLKEMNKSARENQRQKASIPRASGRNPGIDRNVSPSQLYRRAAQRILELNSNKAWSKNPDWSRMDFMVCRDLFRAGHDPERVRAALSEGSPSVITRKVGHLEDYLSRTIEKAGASLGKVAGGSDRSVSRNHPGIR